MIFADSLEDMWKEVVVNSIILEITEEKYRRVFLLPDNF